MTGRKVFHEKLHFREKAASKIKSFENIEYQPKGSEFQIFNDRLPWLKHNKPNLSEDVKSQITKKEYPGQVDTKLDRTREKKFGLQNGNVTGDNRSQGKLNSVSDDQNETNNKKNRSKSRPLNNTASSNTSSKDDQNVLNKENFKTKNNASSAHSSLKNDKNLMNNDNIKTINNNSTNKISYKSDRNLTNDENSNSSNNTFSHSSIDKGGKSLNMKKNMYLSDQINASTETDKTGRLSIEVQASMDRYLKNSLSKRLKRTMVNSITIPGSEIPNPDEKSYFTKHETKTSQFRSNYDTRRSNENFITNEMIDTMLPSLPYSVRESNVKQYSTYTYPKVIKKDPNELGSRTNISPVTHVGIDYLDQYWAHQRQNMINNENIPFNDLDYTSREIGSTRHLYSDSHDESMYLQELFNRKANYVSKKINPNIDRLPDRINKITARNLDKIMV